MNKQWPHIEDDHSPEDPNRSASPPPQQSYAPDEHTRLLPNRLDSTPYLSPDDPAVSPYNLWSVRLVRVITVLLAFIASLWWTLILISLFVTPPGFHAPGSPFFAFSFASVAYPLHRQNNNRINQKQRGRNKTQHADGFTRHGEEEKLPWNRA